MSESAPPMSETLALTAQLRLAAVREMPDVAVALQDVQQYINQLVAVTPVLRELPPGLLGPVILVRKPDNDWTQMRLVPGAGLTLDYDYAAHELRMSVSAGAMDFTDLVATSSVTSPVFIGNLTGNASTVTNGVYTTGAYADPSWITSLAGSKITGPWGGSLAFASLTFAGLVAGQVLRATGPASASFGALGLADPDAVTGVLPNAHTTATPVNTPLTIVSRDAGGAFAGDLTGNVAGNISGATGVFTVSVTTPLLTTASVLNLRTTGANAMTFQTNSVTALTIGATQLVGIGRTATLNLDVQGQFGVSEAGVAYPTVLNGGFAGRYYAIHQAGDWGFVIGRAFNDDLPSNLTLYKTRSAVGARTVVANADYIGRITFQGVSQTAGTVTIGASILAQVSGAVSNGVMPTNLLFVTAATGDATAAVAKWMLQSAGHWTPYTGFTNTYDVGNTGLRPRTVYAATSMIAPSFVGALTGNATTATTLSTSRDFSATGDATAPAVGFTGAANVALALTLATVNADTGTFGSATQAVVLTVNGKGLITAAANAIITPAWGSITGTPTTIAGYGITDFNSLGDARWSLLAHTHTFASLTAIPTTVAGYGITDFNSLGDARWSLLGHTHSFASLTGLPTTIGGYGITDFNALGDARWSLVAHTHTFASLTAKPTTIAGYGITDLTSLGDAQWVQLDAVALPASILASSLTSVGTLASLTVTGAITSTAGKLRAGTLTATAGSTILEGNYGGGAINVIGSMYSTGATMIGYGVSPDLASGTAFVSAVTPAFTRAAFLVSNQEFRWYTGANQTVAVGSAVVMTERMSLTSALLTVGPAATFSSTVVVTSTLTQDGTLASLAQSAVSGRVDVGLGTSAGTTAFRMIAAAGNTRDFAFSSGTTADSGLRWVWRVSGAESGANAGALMELLARSDTGSNLGTVWSIVRAAAGAIAFDTARPVTMGALTVAGTLSASTYGAVGGTLSDNINWYVRGALASVNTSSYAVLIGTTHSASATVGQHGLYIQMAGAAGTYTTANVAQINIRQFTKGSVQTVDNLYGIYIATTTTAVTSTSYGLRILGVTGGVAANYAIYTDAGLVRFGDAMSAVGITSTGAVALSPANLNVVLSPTGTGVVTINPATAGAIDRMVIGATTPLAGTFTTLTASARVTAPLFGTTSAVDVVFDRNSVAQLTLGSLAATFAGSVAGTSWTGTGLIKTTMTSGKQLELQYSAAIFMTGWMRSTGVVEFSVAGGATPKFLFLGGDLTTNLAISTGAPAGAALPWRLGSGVAGVGLVLLATEYLEVSVNGVVKKVALVV